MGINGPTHGIRPLKLAAYGYHARMTSRESLQPIIQTKFCIPHLTPDIIPRQRLLSLLDKSVEIQLTLVSAPAGYGKSVLVSQWLDQQPHKTIWLSLDAGDSDLRQFLSYLVEDIIKEFPGSCARILELIKAPESPPVTVLANHLLNELHAIGEPCLIAFDDYHLLNQSSQIHTLMETLLQHPLEHVHIILITRRDPSLNLTRLRALNQMLDIRMQDLRFTQPEISDMLSSSTGYAASDEALTHLQQEVEGWAVGLRLIALVLRQVQDPDKFLLTLQFLEPSIQQFLRQPKFLHQNQQMSISHRAPPDYSVPNAILVKCRHLQGPYISKFVKLENSTYTPTYMYRNCMRDGHGSGNHIYR